MKIGMAGIFVKSPMEAHKFYTEVLGWQSKVYMPEANLAVVMSADEPTTFLLLGPIDNPLGKTFQEGLYKSGIPAIVMSSNNIAKEYEELVSRGVVFKAPPQQTPYGTSAIFDDTCGNFIQLHQM